MRISIVLRADCAATSPVFQSIVTFIHNNEFRYDELRDEYVGDGFKSAEAAEIASHLFYQISESKNISDIDNFEIKISRENGSVNVI